jgi:hypothetical protein
MTNNFFQNYSYSYNKFNSDLFYCGIDTQELYNKNLKEKKDLLEKNNWIGTEIKYSFNNYGFRTPYNFDVKNPQSGNMFLGCSITEGIGLKLEDIWAYKINKKLGGCFYNLSQGGTGIETMYRLMRSWVPIIKPKNVFIMSIFKNRKEFINRKKHAYDIFGPWLIDKKFKNSGTNKIKRFFYEKFLISEDEAEIFWEKNFDAIKYVSLKNNINLYLPNEKIMESAFVESKKQESFARDCIHTGVVFHDIMADLTNWEKIK